MNKTFKSIRVVALFISCFLASGLFLTSCPGAARQPLVVISNTEQSPIKIFAGETLTQNFNLTNVGNEEAKMVLLSLDISYPFLIMGSSSNFFIGDLEPEESRSVSVGILVDKDANGLYYVGFTITYEDDDGESYTESGTLGFQIFGKPQIDVREVVVGQSPSEIFAGETFTKIFDVTNTGNDEVKMVQLSLDMSYPFAVMESSSNFFIGDLGPGESRPVSVEILVDENAGGEYYIEFTITYKDDHGESYTESGAIFIEVFVKPQIDVREVVVGQSSSKIFTGDTFTESFTLTNLGDREAKMVQLSLNITHPFAMAESSRDLFVGDIEVGESRSISTDISVDKNALVGVYSIPFAIQYKDSNGKSYTQLSAFGVEIYGKPRLYIDEITVDPVPLTPGQGGLMTVRLTNVGTDVARDASMRVFGGKDIIASSFAYIAKIDSMKSESIIFPVSVDGKLEPGTYMLNVTVIYRDDLNNTYDLSKLYEFEVQPITPFVPDFYMIMAVGAAVLALVGYFIYKWKPEDLRKDTETKNPGHIYVGETAPSRGRLEELFMGQQKLVLNLIRMLAVFAFVWYFYWAFIYEVFVWNKPIWESIKSTGVLINYVCCVITLAIIGSVTVSMKGLKVNVVNKSSGRWKHTGKKVLLISCIVVMYAFLLIPYLYHANLENAGVIIYGNEIALESLPGDVQEVCKLRGIVTPVVLLVQHLNPEWVTMVITSRKFSLGTVIEMSDYVVNWRVDWRDFNLVDQTFQRFAIADVRQPGPFESSIESLLSTQLGSIVYDLSKIDFYAGPVLVVLCLTVLLQGRLALWSLPAAVACYSFQVWQLNAIAYEHHLTVAVEWEYFGYLFVALLPLALYAWHFERSWGGRSTAKKMKALSQALGLSRE